MTPLDPDHKTTPGSNRTTGSIRRIGSSIFRLPPRPVTPVPAPPPRLRMKLRRTLVFAMVVAALVPVAIVAMIATGVILSSLETGLRDDADRQLAVGLNLILRAVERLGDETGQLSESNELVVAMASGAPALDAWLARESTHVDRKSVV